MTAPPPPKKEPLTPLGHALTTSGLLLMVFGGGCVMLFVRYYPLQALLTGGIPAVIGFFILRAGNRQRRAPAAEDDDT